MKAQDVSIKVPFKSKDNEGFVISDYREAEQITGILIPLGNKLIAEQYGLSIEASFTFIYKNPEENENLKVGNKINDYTIVEVVYYPQKATICGLKGVE